jgi:hypothetical protein
MDFRSRHLQNANVFLTPEPEDSDLLPRYDRFFVVGNREETHDIDDDPQTLETYELCLEEARFLRMEPQYGYGLVGLPEEAIDDCAGATLSHETKSKRENASVYIEDYPQKLTIQGDEYINKKRRLMYGR